MSLVTYPCEDDAVVRHTETEPSTELLTWLSALRVLSSAATSTVDPRDVLNQVADTARSLLGFTFCGVLIPDPTGQSLVITGWSGLSAEYVNRVNRDRPIRLDGSAPSSRAFTSGEPVAIRDITAEAGFAPWGGVAREQGYRAMIAVPLVSGDQVLGTLNGYYTPRHTFTAHEVERMSLLANHAAIALGSARMLDELRRLTDSLREQRDALTRSEQIHERLLATTLRSGGLDGIATVLAELVGRPVLIDDSRHETLAASGDPAVLPAPAWRETATIDEDASSTPVRVTTGPDNGAAFLVSTARLGGDVAARIWLPEQPTPLDPIGTRAVEHASIVVALELLRVRTAVEVEHRLRGELMTDLLSSGPVPSEQLVQRAALLGHELTRPHAAIVGSIGSAASTATHSHSYQRALTVVSDALRSYQPRPLTAMYRGDIVVLWPTEASAPPDKPGPTQPTDPAHAAKLVQRAIASVTGAADATVAVHEAPADTYAHGYRIAKGALNIAIQVGHTNTVVQLADLGIAGLLLQLDDTSQLLAFADRALGPVLEYDRRHRTQLSETLRTHLACKLDRNRTAQTLHIHPNTVGQRVRRIEQLCATDLADPSAAAHFSAALTIREVALQRTTTAR
jgi:sugar diacid utilization regulator